MKRRNATRRRSKIFFLLSCLVVNVFPIFPPPYPSFAKLFFWVANICCHSQCVHNTVVENDSKCLILQQKSFEWFRKVSKGLEKFRKVKKSSERLRNVLKGIERVLHSSERFQKGSKGFKNFRKVLKSFKKFWNVLKGSEQFWQVPKGSKMFRKVPKMFREVPKCS